MTARNKNLKNEISVRKRKVKFTVGEKSFIIKSIKQGKTIDEINTCFPDISKYTISGYIGYLVKNGLIKSVNPPKEKDKFIEFLNDSKMQITPLDKILSINTEDKSLKDLYIPIPSIEILQIWQKQLLDKYEYLIPVSIILFGYYFDANGNEDEYMINPEDELSDKMIEQLFLSICKITIGSAQWHEYHKDLCNFFQYNKLNTESKYGNLLTQVISEYVLNKNIQTAAFNYNTSFNYCKNIETELKKIFNLGFHLIQPIQLIAENKQLNLIARYSFKDENDSFRVLNVVIIQNDDVRKPLCTKIDEE